MRHLQAIEKRDAHPTPATIFTRRTGPNGLPHNRRRDYDFFKGYSFEQSLARNLIKAAAASAVNAVVILPVALGKV